VAGVEFADKLIEPEGRLPDIEQQPAAGAPAYDSALAVDRGIVPLVFGAAAIEFAGADLQG